MCNTALVGHIGNSGGFRVYRFVDPAGHECAYYDTTLLFPTDVVTGGASPPGVGVLDMTDPAHPVHTASLLTPAMQSPHESLSLNQKRGLLAADMGNPAGRPGSSTSTTCDRLQSTGAEVEPAVRRARPRRRVRARRQHVLRQPTSGPDADRVRCHQSERAGADMGRHELGLHGLNVSDDGNRIYFADIGSQSPTSGTDGSAGLTVLDVSQVQQRVPQSPGRVVSHLTWAHVSIPQTPIPVTITIRQPAPTLPRRGRRVRRDASPICQATTRPHRSVRRASSTSTTKLIPLSSPTSGSSQQQGGRAGDQQNDPGAMSALQGYAGHYCAVPSRVEPGIVACSFILSGLRVFDIRDPAHPREIAYFNKPPAAGGTTSPAVMPCRRRHSSRPGARSGTPTATPASMW